MGMDSHELNIQVAAHGHHRVKNIQRFACSLEAMHEVKETLRPWMLPKHAGMCFYQWACSLSKHRTADQGAVCSMGHDSCGRWAIDPQPLAPSGSGALSEKKLNLHLGPHSETAGIDILLLLRDDLEVVGVLRNAVEAWVMGNLHMIALLKGSTKLDQWLGWIQAESRQASNKVTPTQPSS